MGEKIEIRDVDWGVANRFDDCIEVNRHLKQHPKLYRPIIEHELEHSEKIFDIEDFKHDITSSHSLDQFELMKFMFKHPKSFSQLLPFYWTKKRGLVVDINLSILYFISISVISLFVYFGLRF